MSKFDREKDAMICREIERLDRMNMSDDKLKLRYKEFYARYVENVSEGRGDAASGQAILSYYTTWKALGILAEKRGIDLDAE